MRVIESEHRGTIALLHGSGQTERHWDLLAPELHARGYDTIAVNLPASDPNATYADYAAAAAEEIRPAVKDGRQVDIIPHSGASHTAPELVRLLGKDSVRSIIHISGSLGRSSGEDVNDLATYLVPRNLIPRQRNSEAFRNATLRLESGLTAFNPAMIKQLFFNKCDPETFIWALEQMQVQARPRDEPPLSAHRIQGVPTWYILPEHDRIRDPAWAIQAAGSLGMGIVKMGGDHSPAISRPEELADVVDRLLSSIPSREDVASLPQEPMFWPPRDYK